MNLETFSSRVAGSISIFQDVVQLYKKNVNICSKGKGETGQNL